MIYEFDDITLFVLQVSRGNFFFLIKLHYMIIYFSFYHIVTKLN